MILPKLGIEYGICLKQREIADYDGFFKALHEQLELVEKSLVERFNYMSKQKPTSAPFMYGNGCCADADKNIDTVYESLKNFTLAIGYIGLAETLVALTGKNHFQSAKSQELGLKIVKTIYDFTQEASKRNNLNFSCYASPGESLCHTAMKKLQSQYGIITNVTSREYLTNSHHVPVWEKANIAEKLSLEAPYTKMNTGGTITYIELDSTFMNNVSAIERIIEYAFSLDIPYLAFNFPLDFCEDCGFQGEFTDSCTECGSENIQQLRRVCGYLSTTYKNFNKGKQAEVEERERHEANGFK